jgi:hypothetical protein
MIIAVPRALLRIKASCVTHTIIPLKTNTHWCPSFQIASFFNQVHLTFRWSENYQLYEIRRSRRTGLDRYTEGASYVSLHNYLLEVYPEKDIIQRIM